MLLMILCGALLVAALALIVAWRSETFVVPNAAGNDDSIGHSLRLYLWLLVVGATSGLLAGLLVIGPGGRLAMRLLAATSPDARGRITDAQEVVGDISLDGTIGFFLFVGLLSGPPVAVLYVLLHRALPRGVVGGLAFGLIVLVLFGTVVDPLRPGNPDFDIVGPGWLSVTAFTILAAGTGAFIAATASRLSRLLPLPGKRAFLYVHLWR